LGTSQACPKFARALTEAASQTELSNDSNQEIQQVLDWTTNYANLLDPLINLHDSVEEFVHPEKSIRG
jgi:hypothetical protein